MINTLKVATGGYLKRTTKACLTIAVGAYLSFTSATVPETPIIIYPGGAGISTQLDYKKKVVNKPEIIITVNDVKYSKVKHTGIKVKVSDVEIINSDQDNPTMSITFEK